MGDQISVLVSHMRMSRNKYGYSSEAVDEAAMWVGGKEGDMRAVTKALLQPVPTVPTVQSLCQTASSSNSLRILLRTVRHKLRTKDFYLYA
jgi:hypothetical protein